jgi:hypothetical protein
MLSSVLRSPRAVQVNVVIMRVFVRLRETLALHKELAHKLAELERRIERHDAGIRTLFEAIRHLTKFWIKAAKDEARKFRNHADACWWREPGCVRQSRHEFHELARMDSVSFEFV